MTGIIEQDPPRARLAVLLQHFSDLDDSREPWRVMYPLKEVLLLVTCATIASCDDFDEIAEWGSIISTSCTASATTITASPVSAGCAASSTGSIRRCLRAASRTGLRPNGRADMSSSPSTARPPDGPMIGAGGSKPCTRSAPTRPRRG